MVWAGSLPNLHTQHLFLVPSESKLRLHVYPLSFLVTNRHFSEKLQDPLSEEHHNLSRDLGDVVGMGQVGRGDQGLPRRVRRAMGGRGAALGCPNTPKSWWAAEHNLSSR